MNLFSNKAIGRSLLFGLVAGVLVFVCSCSDSGNKFRIGVSQCSDDEWRSQMNDEIRREMLFHDDAEVEIRTANDDSRRQIADIDYFVDNNFDIIIVSPREAETITPAIKKAYEKGIPIIVFDRTINGPYFTSYIELDNEGVGRAAAKYSLHTMGGREARILEIRGLDSSTPSAERHKGFNSVIANEDNSNVVASVSAFWIEDAAYAATDSLLSLHPEINLIYAHNDRMAIGASRAVRKHGREDIVIVGTDAAPALGIRAVADSLIDASVVYPTDGARVIRSAMKILKGEPFERIEHVPVMYAVDRSNAEILLRQNDLLNDKTRQIETLDERNRITLTRQKEQRYFLYAVIAASLLLIMAVLSLWYMLRQRKKYDTILSSKNRQLEEERDRLDNLYARLQEATNSKLIFFTNVSHDLRTPLTLISEPIRQLAKADYLSEADSKLVSVANRNVLVLRRLIEQILDFRRYENGKMDITMQEVSVAELVREWSEAFKSLASRRLISFDIRTEGECRMAVDVAKTERILFNLLSNAFKFTPDGGKITVDCRIKDESMILSVSDTGIGMTSEEASHVFERFYQVDKVRPTGSGIGLSLTQAFVSMMGGSIEIETNPGNGSVFSVIIPVTHVADEFGGELTDAVIMREQANADYEIERGATSVHEGNKPLVLVIDDNPDITTLLAGILSDSYDVMTASDGRSGLRMALKYIPDLIVCDIMMPVMDGLEFLRRVKEELSTSHIPVLVLTACRLDEQRLESYDSGADSFISKPFSAEMIRSRCANLILNRKRVHNLYSVSAVEPEERKKLDGLAGDSNSLESEFYRKFIGLVAENYKDSELNISDIAEKLGIGPAQLARKIKALTNLSPVDIIRNYRLREARRILLSSDKSISEIAYQTGFSSPQYFSKCFRDFFSETPTDARTK